MSFLLLLEFSGDEMFTDSYKMKVTDDGIFYEVEGKVSKTEKNNEPNRDLYQSQLIGFHHISKHQEEG